MVLFSAISLHAESVTSYIQHNNLSFQEVSGLPDGKTIAVKFATLLITFTQQQSNNGLNLALYQEGLEPSVTISNSANSAETTTGSFYYLVYYNNVLKSSQKLDGQGLENKLIGAKEVKLMNNEVKVEFYIVPDNQNLIEDKNQYTISGLTDELDVVFNIWTEDKKGGKDSDIIVGGNTEIPLIGDNAPITDDGKIIDVPFGEVPKVPTPILFITEEPTPLLNLTTPVQIANISSFWLEVTDSCNVSITINPQGLDLVNGNYAIPYLLLFDDEVVDANGTSFTRTLNDSNSFVNKKLMGNIKARLNLTEAELRTKAAGSYSDTVYISISLDK